MKRFFFLEMPDIFEMLYSQGVAVKKAFLKSGVEQGIYYNITIVTTQTSSQFNNMSKNSFSDGEGCTGVTVEYSKGS